MKPTTPFSVLQPGTNAAGAKPAHPSHVMRSILMLILMSAWIGCAAPGKMLEPPRVNLASLDISETSLFETVFQVDLRVLNPNDVPLTLKGADCEIEVNGESFARGLTDAPYTVPAMGTTKVGVTVYSSVMDVVTHLLSLHKTSLAYKIKGRLRVEGGLLTPSVIPFTSEGELDIKKLMGDTPSDMIRKGMKDLGKALE